MSAQTIQAIETEYAGYKFRSRLEARWAVFFDKSGIEWRYEPEGFRLKSDWLEAGPKRCPNKCTYSCLPDFYLPQVGMWAEVKPGAPSDTELVKMILLAEQTGKQVLLLDDVPAWRTYFAIDHSEFEHGGWDVLLQEYDISEDHERWKSEGRFHSEQQIWEALLSFNLPEERGVQCSGPEPKAIAAARSARFEHGACP